MITMDLIDNTTLIIPKASDPEFCEYDFYQSTEKWLLGVVVLPFIIFGLMANAISIRIFSHRYMRQQSVNWYLLILSISDSFILFCAFFVLTLPRLSEILQFWQGVAVSYYTAPQMFPLMILAQTISVWMTVAMSLHRFVGVCMPFKAGTILRKKNVKCLILSVIIFAILFNATRFFEVSIKGVCYNTPIDYELPVLVATPLRTNPLYHNIYFVWAQTIVMFILPFTILIVVNSRVIVAIHRSRQVHAKLNVCDDSARKQELAKEISTSIMLVAVVVAFMICNTLAFVVNIMERLELYDEMQTITPFSNLLVMCNASINICIYCMFSDKYRHLLCYYLQFLRCRKNENFQVIMSNFDSFKP